MTLLGVAVMRSVCTPDAVASAATLPTSVVMLWASSIKRKLFSGREYLPTKRAGRMTLTKDSNVVLMRTELFGFPFSEKMCFCKRSWLVVVKTTSSRVPERLS
eukprot:2363392-Pleurochrysis_carterae.AAC.1